MALMTVHLAVARRFARERREYLRCPEFYLGAISPDAIYIREKDKRRKNYFHLCNWMGLNFPPLEAYWGHFRTPFDVGYGVHVLTDAFWTVRFRKIPNFFLPDETLNVPMYYREAYISDFALFHRDGTGQELHDLLRAAKVPTDHPLLSPEELRAWREITLTSYEKPCPEDGEAAFFTEEYINAFIEESAGLIIEKHRICFPKADKDAIFAKD